MRSQQNWWVDCFGRVQFETVLLALEDCPFFFFGRLFVLTMVIWSLKYFCSWYIKTPLL